MKIPNDQGSSGERLPCVSVTPFTRRTFLQGVTSLGVGALLGEELLRSGYAFAAGPGGLTGTGGTSSLGTGTMPEQIHLVWGADASSEITVVWASPQPETTPQVSLTPAGGSASVFPATTSTYTDGLSGETVHLYHVALTGLAPATTYTYVVSDNATPSVTFTSMFTTAGTGRFKFSFTSFGDLATPGAGAAYVMADGSTLYSTSYGESQWDAYNAVSEVEALATDQPSDSPLLFHLLNGDLCYGDKQTIVANGDTLPGQSYTSGSTTTYVQPSPEVWRDFGLNVQRSATNRPWMPCIGNHEAELDQAAGSYGYASFNARYPFPSNGTDFPGNFYSFRVGSVVFISLDANDVCYQGAGAYNVGLVNTTDADGNSISAFDCQYNQYYTGTFIQNSNGTLSPGGTDPNAQTQWLENTLASARADTTVDWIIVQMHQCALSSSTDNGCDAGIRQAWVPLFDQYQVDLVLNGHDHDYERSYPVRGFTAGSGYSQWQGSSNTSWPSNYFYSYSTGSIAYGAPLGPVEFSGNPLGTPVNTFTPNVVTDDEASPFDTTKGTVYMVLGGGGTNKRDNAYNPTVYTNSAKTSKLSGATANVTTFSQVRVGGAYNGITGGTKPLPDAGEPAAWSAKTDSTDAYGVALFSVDPGEPGGNTTITVNYYHAGTQAASGSTADQPGPAYVSTAYDSFQLTRPRSDNPGNGLPEFSSPALALPAAAAVAGGALYLQQRLASKRRSVPEPV